MTTESTAGGKHQYLYMRHWPTGAVSIDLVRHHDEMPTAELPVAPRARTHSFMTDALIFKWFDVHGCNSAWDIALHLGGPTAGYTDAWVLQRYCWMVDEMCGSERDEATPAPMLIVDAEYATEVDPKKPTVFIGCAPEPEPEPDPPVTPTPPPTEAPMTRPPTPEKDEKEEKDEATVVLPIQSFGRRSWTEEADDRINAWVGEHGQNWRALARHMGGRRAGYSDDAVRNRYMRIHGIKSTKGRFARGTPTRGPKWSTEEDRTITQLYDADHHNRWKYIASLLSTDRTPAAVRLRAQRLGLFEYKAKTDSC